MVGKVAYGEDRYSKISSPLQGRVVEVRAHLGDRVKAGDTSRHRYSSRHHRCLTRNSSRKLDLEYATRAQELAMELYATKRLALKDLKQAENDLIKARAEFRRAKERLLSLRISASELDKPPAQQRITSRFEMKSPLTGTVVERTVTPGQSVGGDVAVLFTVADGAAAGGGRRVRAGPGVAGEPGGPCQRGSLSLDRLRCGGRFHRRRGRS
ncbi:MAG: efflux RND transporter periplasmic adaptor subunit [Nitrospiraceae bacterium]